MELSLAGRIALITGASRLAGIGAATARMFAAAGADIAFTHWTPYDQASYGTTSSEPETLVNELRDMGVRAEGMEVDLSDASSPARLFDTIEARLGPVSILVNNAAYSTHDDHETLTAESLDRHYAVNVRAMALLSVEFARRFTAGSGGRIINLTSGQSVAPMPAELSYATTKGAIEAFTTSLAPGVAKKGIKVNAVDPGGTDTGWMTDEVKAAITSEMAFGRVGLPEDAARLILFIASDAGRWITGQVIHSRGA
ncbi:MAG TPA: SDR family oxidoreductase [Thermomicrobiales bacterium]|nr:SDR family oxidoreductase [Thermomicrobiales bacterium]